MSFGFRGDSNNPGSKDSSGKSASSETLLAGGPGDKKEAYISKGSKIIGTLQFSGPVEIDGQVDGEVIAQDRLTIGESATINAKLSGAEIIVKGIVNGDIAASKRLTLKKSARVLGGLSSPLLSIEEGVIFEGKIAMVAAEKKSLEVSKNPVESKTSSGQGLPLQSNSKSGVSAV